MVNYNNGKIYKIEPICDHLLGEIYIGSTTKEYLSQRMVDQRGSYNKWKRGIGNCMRSFHLFDKYGIDNCSIELIENVNANSKDELLAREGFHIRNTECVNKLIMGRTSKEYKKVYYEANKEEVLQSQKKYYEVNKEYINERNKIYYETNREQILQTQKEFYKTNNEQFLQRQKEYRDKNRDAINQRERERRKLKKATADV